MPSFDTQNITSVNIIVQLELGMKFERARQPMRLLEDDR